MIWGMKKALIAPFGILIIPGVALAASDNLQSFLSGLAGFFNSTVVPILFALAFLFFLINATRYFIIGGDKEAERAKARTFATWGIIAFVLMVSIWGIVHLIIAGLGIEFWQAQQFPCPDFLPVDECQEDPDNGIFGI